MATVTVINEDGQYEEREIVNRSATIDTDSDPIDIAVAQRIELDHEGMMSQITTVCGETENRREADTQPDITVEGIITKDQLEGLKNLHKDQQITFVSDIDSNEVLVKRVTIEQNTDIIHFTPDGGETQLAFTFQLQLKYPE